MPTLNFKGKSFVENHHLTVKYHQLIPDDKASLTDEINLEDNLIIHGDNLIALKALLPLYSNRVKCIYIDPPYNTGNEGWRYNDNVNSPMLQEWFKSNKPIDKEDLTRHDKWLCMMLPRLNLLKELLTDDGVIFISIDENENHHLKMLMEEVFEADNFIATIVWQKSKKGDVKLIATTHEYILVATKNKSKLIQSGTWRREKAGVQEVLAYYDTLRKKYKKNHGKINEVIRDWYSSLDKDDPRRSHEHYRWSDDRGLYFAADFSGPDDGRKSRPRYDILHPITHKPCKLPSTGWRWDEGRTKLALAENPPRIHFGEDETTIPCRKSYLFNVRSEPYPSVFYRDGRAGTVELERIVGAGLMDFPKNTDVIKELLRLAADDDLIILDSFAGSGTTGQAVLELNLEDGGTRQFILVETEDYARSLTAERIRRVIQGAPNSTKEEVRKGLNGSYSFFELGDALDIEGMLSGTALPSYYDLARYLFYTATGEQFNPTEINEDTSFIGESLNYRVYLFYQPNLEYLRNTALTLNMIKSLPDDKTKARLIFAPTRYVEGEHLRDNNVKFVQIPFEIYRHQV